MTYSVHVDAVGVGPGMLEVLLQPLAQASWDLVEPDELFDPQHLSVIAGRARVQSLDDCRHVSKDTGVHQSCMGQTTGILYVGKCSFEDLFNYENILL